MALLEWSDALALGEDTMDATHREYVDLLNRCGDAPDGTFLDCLDAFIAHTESHFEVENARMEATQFPPSHCHVHEHEQVLLIMKDVRGRVAGGEVYLGRVLATEMGKWFEHHAGTMDKVLAYWLRVGDEGRAQLLAESAAAQAGAHACGAGCEVHGHDHAHEGEAAPQASGAPA